jgi:putative redox protein
MAVEINVEYLGDLHCRAVHGPSQQVLTTDAPVDNGGKGEAFSPTDLVATALAACLATIMALVARRNGFDLAGINVRVVKEMTAAPVRRIGTLKVTVTVPHAAHMSAEHRAKLEAAAQACPVKQSLHPDVAVEIAFVYEAPQGS